MIPSNELYHAYAALCRYLGSNPSVINVGIGLREEKGRLFDEFALRVYVRRESEAINLGRDFCGIPVSVVAPGIELYGSPADPARHRTLRGGIKVSSLLSSGTMGAIVKHRQSENLLGLTCAHVIGFTALGLSIAPVYQPDFPAFAAGAPLDPADALGDTSQGEGAFIVTPTLPPQIVGFVDAAVFKLDKSVQRDPPSYFPAQN